MQERVGRFESGREDPGFPGRRASGFRALFRPRDGVAPSRSELRNAWLLAIFADWVQIVLIPFFWAGALSPANDLLDVTVAVLMIRWLGWHPALLPSFIAELIPGLGLFPTWTLSVWVATRGQRNKVRPAATSPS